MASTKLTPKQNKAFSWGFILIGLSIISVSVGLPPIDESTLHAPKWVLGLCGLVFSLAGIIMSLNKKSPLIDLFVGLLVLSFGLVGGWVALFGGTEQFSGGSSILSHSQNAFVARLLFGSGSIMCFAITIYALRQYFQKKGASHSDNSFKK